LKTLTELIQQKAACWCELDFARLETLWDLSQPPVYFAEEAPAPSLSWDALREYWRFTAGSIAKMHMIILREPQYQQLADNLVTGFYEMHWDALMCNQPKPIGGENRVCATFRQTTEGWRFAQYVEAPLAPITYMRRLYEQCVTPGFADPQSRS
jgi:hypothetical protein